MGIDSEQDDLDVQIVDLPETSDEPAHKQTLPLPHLLRARPSAKQRRLGYIFVTFIATLIVLVILTSTTVRDLAFGVFVGVFPTPTATVPANAGLFYVEADLPWGRLFIDGQLVKHLPVLHKDAPLHLSPGRHTLQWRADPFLPQTCMLSVPPNFSTDTCADNNATQVQSGLYALVVTFTHSLSQLPPVQQAALITAAQVALGGQQSTVLVNQGEGYRVYGKCISAQPDPVQFSGCFETARQPLKATLSFQADTDANANQPCASPEQLQACSLSGQNCHLFCSFGFSASAWQAGLAVRAFWTLTARNGRFVAQNSPENMDEENLVALQITWDGAGWHVTTAFGNPSVSQPLFGYPICQLVSMNTNLLGDPNLSTAMPLRSIQWDFVAGPVQAAGCVGVATANPELVTTPTPPAQIAYLLYRFGVLLAANHIAHLYWPYLPVADAYEQQLASQIVATSAHANGH